MSWLTKYKDITSQTKRLILMEFFLQTINSSYFLIFNYYLNSLELSDDYIAQLISYRFLITMFIALPVGFYVRNRPIAPLFRLAVILLPLGSFLTLYFAESQNTSLLKAAVMLMGMGATFVQVLMIPFIMRNEPVASRMEAIALHFTTWSTTTFLLGCVAFLGKSILGEAIPELQYLTGVTIMGTLGALIVFFKIQEDIPQDREAPMGLRQRYDWLPIAKVLLPAMIIGIGAGLTIPFINLFFLHVFAMPYENFAIMGSVSTIFVTAGSMYGPRLKQRLGTRYAIVSSQGIAIAALIGMAFTSFFSEFLLAYVLACLCYLIRQPLMNLANPLISSFTMEYVGERNREMASALQQSLWAGSWFFSSHIFAILRGDGQAYSTILLTTAAIYALGVFLYDRLLRQTEAG